MILSFLKSFISKITLTNIVKYKNYIILVVFFILASALFYQHQKINSLKVNLKITEQNKSAALDSLRKIILKDGQEATVKFSFLEKTVKDLKKDNYELWEKVKNQTGEVHNASNIGIEIKHDTITMKSKLDSGKATFNYIDSSKGGKIGFGGRVLLIPKDSVAVIVEKLLVELEITTGIEKVSGKIQAFATCENPNVRFTKLNSVSFDVGVFVKPVNKFLLGLKWFSIGFGLGGAGTAAYFLLR
jgi:hypothetical protein